MSNRNKKMLQKVLLIEGFMFLFSLLVGVVRPAKLGCRSVADASLLLLLLLAFLCTSVLLRWYQALLLFCVPPHWLHRLIGWNVVITRAAAGVGALAACIIQINVHAMLRWFSMLPYCIPLLSHLECAEFECCELWICWVDHPVVVVWNVNYISGIIEGKYGLNKGRRGVNCMNSTKSIQNKIQS